METGYYLCPCPPFFLFFSPVPLQPTEHHVLDSWCRYVPMYVHTLLLVGRRLEVGCLVR